MMWIDVLAIQITTSHRNSIVAGNDTVWIDAGHYFEDYAFPELLSHFQITGDELEEALHHVARVGLSRMNSTRHDDDSLFAVVGYDLVLPQLRLHHHVEVLFLYSACDNEVRHVHSGETLAQRTRLFEVSLIRRLFEIGEESRKPREGVGIVVSEVRLVLIFPFELVLKAHLEEPRATVVVVLDAGLFILQHLMALHDLVQFRRSILDVLASSDPADGITVVYFAF